ADGLRFGGLDGEGRAEHERLSGRLGSPRRIHHGHGTITINPAPGGQAPREPPVKAPERAIPQVIEVELVDDRLHRHHELGELVTGLDAVLHGDELYAAPLEEPAQSA